MCSYPCSRGRVSATREAEANSKPLPASGRKRAIVLVTAYFASDFISDFIADFA